MGTLKNRIENIRNEILQRIETGDFKLEEAYFDSNIENPVAMIDIDRYKLRLSIHLDMDFFYQMNSSLIDEEVIVFSNGTSLPKTLKEIGENVLLMNKEE